MSVHKVFLILVVLVFHSGVCTATDITPILPYLSTQEQSNWCWAAVSQSLVKYYGNSPRQCDLVDTAFGFSGTNSSCVNVKDGGFYEDSTWNKALSTYNIQKVLSRWGVSSTATGTYLPQSECVTEITAQQPFVIAKLWGTPSNVQGGHALLAYGYEGTNIRYWDPTLPENGGGQNSEPYTSLVSNPTAPDPYFWGNTIKNIRNSNELTTWFVADIVPPYDTYDGYATIGGYVNISSPVGELLINIDYGTTTSYEGGTLYVPNSIVPSEPRPASVDPVYIIIPRNEANITRHFRARTIQTGWPSATLINISSDQTFLAPPASPVPPSDQTYSLTTSKTGTGTVTSTSPSSPTINCGSTCSASYAKNASVTLQATPAPASWTGCDIVNGSSCTVTMSTSRSVVANFAPPVNGVCGSANQQYFFGVPSGDLCSIGIASPLAISSSDLWSWTCKGIDGSTASCTAGGCAFRYKLATTKIGSGTGTITISPLDAPLDVDGVSCSSINSIETLTAHPSAGSVFTGWSGACSGTNDCVLNMNANKSVTATFAFLDTLTVIKAGLAPGTVSISPLGTTNSNCADGSNCYGYDQNTPVTLTATPDAGYQFDGWSGACSGTDACVVNMDQAKTVMATFNPPVAVGPPTINVVNSGCGSVSPAGPVTLSQGSNQTFNFQPSAGSYLAGVLVNGLSVGTGLSYPFTNVIANHTISPFFSYPDGDVNNDGHVDIPDALITLQAAVGLRPVIPQILARGDIAPLGANGYPAPDKQVTVADALVILRKVVGLVNWNVVCGTLQQSLAVNDFPITTNSTSLLSLTPSGNGSYAIQGTNMDGVSGIQLTIAYNTTTLGSPTVALGSLTTDATLAVNTTSNPGYIIIGIMTTSTFSGSGPIAVINFATWDSASAVPKIIMYDLSDINGRSVGGGTLLSTVTSSVSGSYGNGTITPVYTQIISGGIATLNITPDAGYHLSSLTDNGVNVISSVSGNTYTIYNVTANHNIIATFTINSAIYGVNAAVTGGNGTITPTSTNIIYGGTVTFAITPDAGYHLSSLTDNGTNVISSVSGNTYTITNITALHNVVATFAPALGPPTDVSASAGIAQATIYFTPPASNDGSPITSYLVTSNPGNFIIYGASSPITLTGLNGGTTYTFTVKAINTAGIGPASAPSNSVTPTYTVPGTPVGVSAYAGNALATVYFTTPTSNGSTITSYAVTSSPGNITATGTTIPVVVTGLTNGVTYTFKVTATNAAGTSPVSAPSNSVMPSTSVAPVPAELNIYGSSAQNLYWSGLLQNFTQARLGCTATSISSSGMHSIFHAVGCTSTLVPVDITTGTRDLDIRYSGVTSADGILAISKQAPLDPALVSGCNTGNGERLMYASASTTGCKKVHATTSDVAGESLLQISSGQKLGPMSGGQFDITLPGYDMSSLTPYTTVVVPFGFFANKAVTAKTCTSGLIGSYCSINTMCDTVYGKGDGTCGAPTTITNISRLEATLLFAGMVADWSDLGAFFTPQPVVACLQHAGSGATAALDLMVMNSGWGSNIFVAEQSGGGMSTVWFNQSAGDEMKCINGSSTANQNGSLIGGIGYASADQAVGVANISQNVTQLKYNGYYPTRTTIRNGQYDFYSDAWLYTNPANSATANAIAASLAAFAQNPASVPADSINYWAARGEMKFDRLYDSSYPGFIGASNPQLP